jgi:ADP-ribose pyrophosphatase YjhB (NUDIX family)
VQLGSLAVMLASGEIVAFERWNPDVPAPVSALEVLLVYHPGGPFWRNKGNGAWTIPKGEMAEGEDAAIAAGRKFLEETGYDL